MPNNGKDWIALIISLLIPHAAGAVGSVFTIGAIPLWYDTLILPAFAPPNWVFGPVWLILYTLMGIALYIVWKTRGEEAEKSQNRKRGLSIFGIHIIVNALWSILFFGFQNPLYALVDIVVLLILIVATIYHFYKVRKLTAYLLIPYLLWVAFAAILNLSIYLLN